MSYQAEQGMPRVQRSLGTLVADLFRETADLLRGEVRLAKAELAEKVTQVETGAVSFAIAYVLCFLGVLILLEAAVIALANVVPAWLAAVIVGAVVLTIGLIFLGKAKKNLSVKNMSLKATSESLRRDKQVLKEATR